MLCRQAIDGGILRAAVGGALASQEGAQLIVEPLRNDDSDPRGTAVPSSLKSFEEFDRLLATVRVEIDSMLADDPDDGAILSVKQQLEVLNGWTRGGRCPSQAEKDQLNFGQIASRALDAYPVSKALYKLASFVIYWGEPLDRA